MFICRIVGSVVSTVKDSSLHAGKLLLVKYADPKGDDEGAIFIALDTVGAGEGELVMVAIGSSAREALNLHDKNSPVDAAIVGIIDSISQKSKITFDKNA